MVIGVCSYYLLNYDKLTIHQKINSVVGNPYLDTFFMYFTHAGDGVLALVAAVLLFFISMRAGLFLLLSHAFSGGLAALLKNYVFEYERPHFIFGYFYRDIPIKYIEGVDIQALNSFPSGHATTSFTVYTCLALLSRNMFLKVFFLIIALLSAYSRTYLSQHWLIDLYAGSLIGISITTLFYFIVYHNKTVVAKLDRPLFKVNK